MATTLIKRQEAISKCHGIVTNPEAFIKALEALGLLVIEPDYSPERKALHAIMTETEVRQGDDYGKLTCGYISEYGSGCIIDGLEARGFKIVKI